jgi:pimeloyl-ACP methyl ester carboxylesterase
MKVDPSWQVMEKMAHTLAYDGMVMGETQSGNAAASRRWKVSVLTLIITGENSEPCFRDAAQALADLLPQAEHQVLAGQDHSAVMMASDVLAQLITDFCLRRPV